ncbi:MAG TPA: IS1595 family transposase, partial [Steroidobacteraceae bacterium]
GPICPHCGGVGKAYRIKANPAKRVRHGLWKCGHCRKQFTVKIATVFEHARIPLHKCLQGAYLLCASKKGFSSNQLARTLQISLKAAWFLSHRIRETMREGQLAPFGVNGGAVEVDETFIGREPDMQKKSAWHHKMKVLSLVDRDSGKARSIVIDDVKTATIAPLVRENLAKEARLMTDEGTHYLKLGKEFAAHGIVRHKAKEYVSFQNPDIHTNTIEGYFSIFKRGMKGVYQHCQKQHLHRYLAEFDFRYSNRVALECDDFERTIRALIGAKGKRLTYKPLVNLAPQA